MRDVKIRRMPEEVYSCKPGFKAYFRHPWHVVDASDTNQIVSSFTSGNKAKLKKYIKGIRDFNFVGEAN